MDNFLTKSNKSIQRHSLYNHAARSHAITLYNQFSNNKKAIEKELQKINPVEIRIAIAKQFFFLFGDIEISDLSNERAKEKRSKQFLNIGVDYNFTVQELLDNNKLPDIEKSNITKGEPIFFTLDLRFLKIKSLKGLTEINNYETITDILLDGNKINKIKDNAFKNSKGLILLSLKYNNLCQIDVNAFKKLPNIGELFLVKTYLSDLDKQRICTGLPSTNIYFSK